MGIKDENTRTGNVVKALEGGLAGVAGGRRQHDALASLAPLRARRGDELRQHRKRHVLERGCRAAEELQHIVLSDLDKRCKLIRLKFSGIRAAAELVHAVDVRQQIREQHGLDPERVQRQTAQPVKGVLSERRVDEQPSVRRDPAQDSLRRTGRGAAPRADINHAASLPLFHMPNIIRRIVKDFYPFVEKERKACI